MLHLPAVQQARLAAALRGGIPLTVLLRILIDSEDGETKRQGDEEMKLYRPALLVSPSPCLLVLNIEP
jgi:hypothetical protein